MTSVLLGAALIAGGALPNLPPAETWDVAATGTAGSGLSFAGTSGGTLLARSPMYLNVDFGFVHPQLRAVEFAPTLMLEIEGRVAVGVNAKIRTFVPQTRRRKPLPVRAFGIFGLPVYVVPFTLAGLQAGAGLTFRLHRRYSFIIQGTATAYVLGTDLMEGGALGKFDLDGGLRVHF